MSVLTLTLPEINAPDKTQDPKINTALTAIQTTINGTLDSSNMSATGNQIFPKLLTARSVHLNYGSVSVAWGGATHVTKVVTHELGVSPALAVGCCTRSSTAAVATSLVGVSGTTIEFFLENVGGVAATTEDTLFWLAIG